MQMKNKRQSANHYFDPDLEKKIPRAKARDGLEGIMEKGGVVVSNSTIIK